MDIQVPMIGNRLGLARESDGGGLVLNRRFLEQTLLGCYKTVSVPTASVLTLNATPYSIVAAPAAGYAIIPTRMLVYKPAGTAYAGIAAGEDLVLKYTDASGAQITGVVEATGFLDQATAQTRVVFPPASSGSTAGDYTPVAAAAAVLHMLTGEVTTGTSALIVRVWYDLIRMVITV